jgi:hypothetical protein
MRRSGLGLTTLLWLAACTEPPAPAPAGATEAGAAGHLALHGQVMVTHPPGTEDARAMVRREATARCPGGSFTIRSLNTGAPATGDFTVGLLNYQAVVDCGAAGSD